jgi:two-component system LytT family sensor kinase
MQPCAPSSFVAYSAVNFVFYSTGLAVTIVLLVLVVRTSRLPGTPRANILCAICALVWNLGGLATTAAFALGAPEGSPAALFLSALQFTGAAAWPLPILTIWRPAALLGWQKIGSRILQIVAVVSGSAIIVALWMLAALGGTRKQYDVMELTSFNGSVLLTAGAVLLLKGRMTSRVTKFASAGILFGVLVSSVGILIQKGFHLPENGDAALALWLMSAHSTLLIVLGAFFLFARFRFADVFIRYTVRILFASLLAVLLILISESPSLRHAASLTQFPAAVHLFASSLLAAVLLVSFIFLDRRSGELVNRWIFQSPDYRLAARQFDETLAHLYDDSEIAGVAESSIRTTLELNEVRLVRVETQRETNWPAGLRNGEVFELDSANRLRDTVAMPGVELLVPVRSAGCVNHVLAISPGPARRGLVSEEINFLRMVAVHVGSRFDSVRLERETIERRSRETLLLQQVTEAELRALRAQINPHFLFNSLNSIANLIEANPTAAETMTLRLARVFRYVLAHSSQATSSLYDEMEFLRTYLDIEEARFGDRLNVRFDVAPDAATEYIPSLILQPIVENALKHGLAPKVGPVCLWISARLQGDELCVKVEDDGIGAGWATVRNKNGDLGLPVKESKRHSPSGMGLIDERLDTFYQHRARLSLESREGGGTCVTLIMPRLNGVTAS